jgi:DedD protein
MDSALKQRLLGAAVLIALLIIFVPMFLGSSPPKEASAIQNLDIPPLPERKFETRTLPVESSTPANPAAPKPSTDDKVATVDTKAPATFEAPDAKAPEKAPAASATTSPPAQAATDAKTAADAAKPVPADAAPGPTSPGGRFSVNLGVYADQGHADALVAKLKKAGFAAYSETTEYQGKSAQRVRVGPYADRAAAESARLKIKQDDPKLPSSVTESAQQPTVDAPATAIAANKAGGWAVQLGAFKSEAEAAKLRDRVHGVGVAAFADRTGSGDQALWRVRAGPYADRTGAEMARATLKAKLQVEGMIVTQP